MSILRGIATNKILADQHNVDNQLDVFVLVLHVAIVAVKSVSRPSLGNPKCIFQSLHINPATLL